MTRWLRSDASSSANADGESTSTSSSATSGMEGDCCMVGCDGLYAIAAGGEARERRRISSCRSFSLCRLLDSRGNNPCLPNIWGGGAANQNVRGQTSSSASKPLSSSLPCSYSLQTRHFKLWPFNVDRFWRRVSSIKISLWRDIT